MIAQNAPRCVQEARSTIPIENKAKSPLHPKRFLSGSIATRVPALVSVAVSVGFGITCVSLLGDARWKLWEGPRTQAILAVLRFGALRCEMDYRDFKSPAHGPKTSVSGRSNLRNLGKSNPTHTDGVGGRFLGRLCKHSGLSSQAVLCPSLPACFPRKWLK